MKNFNLINELRELNVSWDEIKDTVDWFTDNDRKVYSGWLLGKEESEDSDLIKLAKQKQAIRISRKELGLERSINNEQIRDITLHQSFTKQLISAITERFNENTITYKGTDEKPNREHIFTMADYHYDGDVDSLEVFNLAFNEIIKVVREKKLEAIHLFELGDLVEGASLRTSQLMAVKSGMVNQIVDVSTQYIKFLTKLQDIVDVYFYSVDSSNHTQLRNLGTKQNQLVEEDLMIVFNKMVRTALPNLKMVTGRDLYVKIAGFNMYASHGHLIRSKEKYLETVASNRNILIDYGFFAHFHHQRTIDLHSSDGYDKKVFYVPSLATRVSDYEIDKELSSLPGIGYYVFEDGKGHIETRKLTFRCE